MPVGVAPEPVTVTGTLRVAPVFAVAEAGVTETVGAIGAGVTVTGDDGGVVPVAGA